MPEQFSEQARQKTAKELATGQKYLRSYLNELRNSAKLLEEGAKALKDTEQDYINQGVEKIAKKGKLFMRSLRALGDLADKTIVAAEEIEIPESDELVYDELKSLNRNLGKVVGKVGRDLATADHIMGLDFAMLRRKVSSPYKRLRTFNDKIRDLLSQEYDAVRIIENLERLEKGIADDEEQIADFEAQIQELEKKQEELEGKQIEADELRAQLDQNEAMQNMRNLIVKAKSFDLRISKKINPLRKVFRKYVQLADHGDIDVPFDLVTIAREYEKDVLDEILEEDDGQPALLRLLESMQSLVNQGALKGKGKEAERIKNAINSIKSGKIDEWKHQYLKLNQNLEEQKKLPENQAIVEDLDRIETLQKDLQENLEKTQETLKLTKRRKQKQEDSLEDKMYTVKKYMKELEENH
ncbi:MAG: hypothetical protein ACFFC7_20785 [Candidatus Hermodarchaeota archaeon]